MQLASVGRNEPCPCGSGRKFKKCCLEATDAAIAGDATDLNVGALIDAAIETDDWDALHDHVEDALALFEPGEPLEHVRFRDDFVGVREPEPTQLAKWCTPGWLRWCELELAYVLDRYELGRGHREGLRVAVHLLRRFGARSPVVEELASLQVAEHIYRLRRLATALSNNRVPRDSPALAVDEVVTWIEQVKPPILSFADWFALRTVAEDLVEATWYSGVRSRVGESCLDRLDDPELDEPLLWLQLATTALLGNAPSLGPLLAFLTPPLRPTADERVVYEGFHLDVRSERFRGSVSRVLEATEARDDFAGAALLREAIRRLQARRR